MRVYTTPFCPSCIAAKRLLRNKGVPFEEVDVSAEPAARSRLVEQTGRRTVPQIFVDEQAIGGYEELLALDATGELDRMLGT